MGGRSVREDPVGDELDSVLRLEELQHLSLGSGARMEHGLTRVELPRSDPIVCRRCDGRQENESAESRQRNLEQVLTHASPPSKCRTRSFDHVSRHHMPQEMEQLAVPAAGLRRAGFRADQRALLEGVARKGGSAVSGGVRQGGGAKGGTRILRFPERNARLALIGSPLTPRFVRGFVRVPDGAARTPSTSPPPSPRQLACLRGSCAEVVARPTPGLPTTSRSGAAAPAAAAT